MTTFAPPGPYQPAGLRRHVSIGSNFAGATGKHGGARTAQAGRLCACVCVYFLPDLGALTSQVTMFKHPLSSHALLGCAALLDIRSTLLCQITLLI